MKEWLLASAVVILISICGCSSSPARGTVEGRLLWGSGFDDFRSPNDGRITATSPDGTRTTVHTGAGGRFELTVPVGVTALTGRSPNFNQGRTQCRARHKVKVLENAQASADVICFVR